jgi:hypothetical protein
MPKKTIDPSLGLTIVNVRKMSLAECQKEGWSSRVPPTVLERDDGSRDEEGNGPGELFRRKGAKSWIFVVEDQ